MNKKLKKIVSGIIIGSTLGVLGNVALPAQSAFAAYDQSNLSMQTIYHEDGYVIAEVNASYLALIQSVYMFCSAPSVSFYQYYEAPTTVGTTYADDGTEITVTENGEKHTSKYDDMYLITFKIKESLLPTASDLKAVFNVDASVESQYPYYEDTNNGNGYTL